MTEEDFRCPYCHKEGQIVGHRHLSSEFNVMIYCKKHKFIFFNKRYKGIFSPQPYWESRQAKTSDFACKNCKHYGINKYSEEGEDSINKACALNIPFTENPSYNPEYQFRMGQTTACNKFKHKEVK